MAAQTARESGLAAQHRPGRTAQSICGTRNGDVVMRAITILSAMIALACPMIHAETLEFQLPTITGGFIYPCYEESVQYTGEPVNVSSVSLRIEASVDKIGGMTCPQAPPLPGYHCTIDIQMGGYVRKSEPVKGRHEYYKYYETITQAGDIDKVVVLETLPGFSGLNSSDIILVDFYFFWNVCCIPGFFVEPEATLTSVTLLIEVTDLVSVEQTTWGCIKSIFDLE